MCKKNIYVRDGGKRADFLTVALLSQTSVRNQETYGTMNGVYIFPPCLLKVPIHSNKSMKWRKGSPKTLLGSTMQCM